MDSPLKQSGHHFKNDALPSFINNNNNNNKNSDDIISVDTNTTTTTTTTTIKTTPPSISGNLSSIGASLNRNSMNNIGASLGNNKFDMPTIVVNKFSKRGGANLTKDELFQLGLDLMHSEKGLKLQKRKKNFLAAPTSCFSGQQLIDWLTENLCISRKDSLVVAYKLVNLNIFFETGINPNNGGSGISTMTEANSANIHNNNNNNTTESSSSSTPLSSTYGAIFSTTPTFTNNNNSFNNNNGSSSYSSGFTFPQPSTSAPISTTNGINLKNPLVSQSSQPLPSSPLKTSTSTFMPPPSSSLTSGGGGLSPLKSSSSSSFTNPNFSTISTTSSSTNNIKPPVEDNPDVYYEFLTKPEAIISHVSMKRLSELHLAHKTLTSIPTTIINTLNYLKVLDFSYNALQDHTTLESVSTLYGLESLNLSYNALSDLPTSISRLEKLTKLNLSNNNFVNIPTCIFQLYSLEKLNMSCNTIITIPETIQHLYKSLAHLDLRNNKITKLPKEVGLLAKLHTLDVSGYNKIIELPAYLATLPMLENLEFPDSVKVPPRSVTSKGFSHIMGHLRDMIDGTVQLTDVKLIVLGPEKSGKSQLIRALTKSSSNKTIKMGTMRRHSGSISTSSSSSGASIINPHFDIPQIGESVELTEWKLDLPIQPQQSQSLGGSSNSLSAPPSSLTESSPKTLRSSKLSKRSVKLMAMDFKFANNAIYTSTSPFFLSERAFYLITVDVTKDPLSQLDFWVNSVKSKAPTAPIYIVATHIDHYAGDIMKSLHLIEGFLNERMLEVTGVIGVATTTSRNIDLLKQEIITTLTNQCNHWFSEQTPAVYVQLEKQLEEEARRRSPPIIAWEEYVNIAKLSNITTHEKLVRATNTLHRWGSIMWFDEDKHGLSDLVILSPQWLSDCFAAIVMSKNTHIQSDSILSLNKLHHIWKDPGVPGFLHMKLIKMLERFNILFTLKSSGQNTSLQDLSLPLSESNRSVSSPLPTLSPEPVLHTTSSFISTSSTSSFMTSIVNSSPSMLRSSVKLLKPSNVNSSSSNSSSSVTTPGNISASSSHENIVQFLQGTKIIVPCLLPTSKPSHLASMWDTWGGEDMHQVGRYYTFLNAPKSCFDRLMVRFLYTMEPIVYYGSGILFRKPQSMKDSVKNNMSSCGTLVEFDNRSQQIQVRVRGHDQDSTSKLFQLVLENVETCLKDLSIKPSKVVATCSCSLECHLDKQTPTYPIEMVESAFGKGEAYIKCPKSQKLVSIERLSPDIALACPSTTKIGAEDLSEFKEIGAGASAKVFKATLRGNQNVAVKQFSLDRMDLTESLHLGVGMGGSGSPTPNSSGHHFTRAPSSSSLSSMSSADEANQLQTKLLAINEFRREVWLMSDLIHPNIVHMKGYCLDPYSIVMEYMDLGSLSSYLRQKSQMGEILPWDIILKIAKDIARGMSFLHNISPPLVHRDLKSPNILLATIPTEPYIVAKISDFGLSRFHFATSFLSKVVDNPTWLPPEVINQREYNEKGDIYSLGIILWELYHMQLPFEEFDIKFMSALEDSIVSGLRPTINPQCNAMYASLITKCWNADPQSRPSLTTILKALDDIQDNIKKTNNNNIGHNSLPKQS